MTPEMRVKLKSLLLQHEKFKQFPYSDMRGHITIGIGRNLSERGISTNEALALLDDDIFYFSSKLHILLSFYNALDESRQLCLLNIIFHLGVNDFLACEALLLAVEKGDYEKASKEILNCKGAHNAPERYQQLAYIMRTGEID